MTANEPLSPLTNSSIDHLHTAASTTLAALAASATRKVSTQASPITTRLLQLANYNSPSKDVNAEDIIQNRSSLPSHNPKHEDERLENIDEGPEEIDEKLDEVDETVEDAEGKVEGENDLASTATPTASLTETNSDISAVTESIPTTTTIATMSTRRLLLNHKLNSLSGRTGRAGIRDKLVSLA